MPEFSIRKSTEEDCRKAKKLRRESPRAERFMWAELRNLSKATGARFRRQHPLHPYIVDFVCLKSNLVIEIDGLSHDARQRHDQERDKKLSQMGYRVLRFTNEDIYQNREAVVQTICSLMDKC